MKIKVSITREYDTEGEHAELFEGISLTEKYALSLFADDIEQMVSDNAVIQSATMEMIK